MLKELIAISNKYQIGREFVAKRGMMKYPKKFKQEYLDEYADFCVLAIEWMNKEKMTHEKIFDCLILFSDISQIRNNYFSKDSQD